MKPRGNRWDNGVLLLLLLLLLLLPMLYLTPVSH
jgi:hypothetical protein